MGFWNKLGKIALQAAPYVAAPFTAGASLSAVPLTKQLGEKWAQSDANKAAQRGVGPSSFDKILGMGSNMASMAGGMGAFGRMSPSMSAGNFGGGGGQGIAPSSSIWERIMGQMGGGGGSQYRTPDFNPAGGGRFGGGGGGIPGLGGIMSRIPELMGRGTRGIGPSQGMGQSRPRVDMSQGYDPYSANPNLGYPIEAGRRDAMRNQPWRKAPIAEDPTMQLPNIYPQYQ